MANHSTEWGQRLHQLYNEPNILETGSVVKRPDLPIPKLTRQTNMCSFPEYEPLCESPRYNVYIDDNKNDCVSEQNRNIQTNKHTHWLEFFGINISQEIPNTGVCNNIEDYGEANIWV